MPFRSKSQEKWAHTPEGMKALGGPSKVKEWESDTPHNLPERLHMKPDLSAAAHGLAHPTKKSVKKHQKEMHIKEMHDGSHHVMKHDGKGGVTEHMAANMKDLHAHVQDHFGPEEEAEGGAPEEEQAEGEM